MNVDATTELQQAIEAAFAAGTPLAIRGSGSKAFLQDGGSGAPLDMTPHRGILSYEPSELVLTARAGTSLAVIESVLAEHGQMLACEPPHFGPHATLGGTVACGLSGPRRPYAGALRDFVLGARIVNGRGELLKFGGQVMKNVAGFDVARLMVGAYGTLGVLLDVTLKVLPRPAYETTLRLACEEHEALLLLADWAGKPLPVSAAAWLEGALYVRLSGTQAAVDATARQVIAEQIGAHSAFWHGMREQTLPFFQLQGRETLWRLSLPPAAPPLDLPGRLCLDWGGALRWLITESASETVFAAARAAGGVAMSFRGGAEAGLPRIQLDVGVAALQQRIRQAFDPARILNRGAT